MKRSELTEFAVEDGDFKLKIRRGPAGLPLVSSTDSNQGRTATAEHSRPSTTPSAASPTTPAATVTDEDPGIVYIKSPMVGTFYRAASPESPTFAEVGAKVTETSVVCIIEAMKIMNEIQGEVKGTILEVLVENGQPVEYGQRLFKLRQG